MAIQVTFPDGTRQELPDGATGLDALRAAGISRLNDIVAVEVDGEVRDLLRPLPGDCRVAPVTADSPQGLEVLRHSCAHLMAQAVKRLFPDVQITIGPVIEDGFYYDFKRDEGFTPEDLKKIEEVMRRIAAEDLEIRREEMPRQQAIEYFRGLGEEYKARIIQDLPDATVSLYRQGEFVDLCRGPHVPSTGKLRAFRLTSVAGAYWRGDERNEMLQRIYGTAWARQRDLDAYLHRLEEARKRDHRRLGRELDLFSFDPVAPGSPFFHPKGAFVYNRLIEYMREHYRRYGYQEVITPQVMDVELWHRSGHYENYKENMFFTSLEGREFAIKPMNCPSHCLIYASRTRSYRDLPIRYADFGRLHRAERSGTLHGLTRVRSFSQDDAHIFCAPEQIESEIVQLLEMIDQVYRDFGFDDRRIYLSTRPEKSIGSDEMWERAERALADALDRARLPYRVNPGDGAFYGPKIDVVVLDAIGREWQLATVQLDFGALPERFGLEYIRPDGSAARPVMIHRAVLGTLERFMGILIEHCAGAFPFWLAPEQVRVLTLTDRNVEYGRLVRERLREAGLRAELDARNEKLGYKIREAQVHKVPYMLVVGDKEQANGTVAPRSRDRGAGEAVPLEQMIAELVRLNRVRAGEISTEDKENGQAQDQPRRGEAVS